MLFLAISFSVVFTIIISIFNPIFTATSLLFPYAINPFDIVKVYPNTWSLLKKLYLLTSFISFFILFNKLFNLIYSIFPDIKRPKKLKIKKETTDELSLLLGLSNKTPFYLSEKGLYQNLLITGTIGTGKTSSAMYPFTKQLINYKKDSVNEKLAMLILDVKGNYFNQVVDFAIDSIRLKDLISIDLSGNFKYNPLDKPRPFSNRISKQIKNHFDFV